MAENRYQLVDVLRGCAIALMMAYHLVFDLNYFVRLGLDFNHDPLWLGLRALIVSLFLGLVGVSLHLATRKGVNRGRYLRRLGRIILCAALVTVGSAVVFPDSLIFFGILHFIVVASVLGLLMTRFFWINLWAGLGLLALGLSVKHPVFDEPVLQWVGLMTHKPVTEDYVPLLPWFGVVLIGIFLGKLLYREPLTGIAVWNSPAPAFRALAFGGRHSLLIYMLHQPVFFGVIYLVLQVTGT